MKDLIELAAIFIFILALDAIIYTVVSVGKENEQQKLPLEHSQCEK